LLQPCQSCVEGGRFEVFGVFRPLIPANEISTLVFLSVTCSYWKPLGTRTGSIANGNKFIGILGALVVPLANVQKSRRSLIPCWGDSKRLYALYSPFNLGLQAATSPKVRLKPMQNTTIFPRRKPFLPAIPSSLHTTTIVRISRGGTSTKATLP